MRVLEDDSPFEHAPNPNKLLARTSPKHVRKAPRSDTRGIRLGGRQELLSQLERKSMELKTSVEQQLEVLAKQSDNFKAREGWGGARPSCARAGWRPFWQRGAPGF